MSVNPGFGGQKFIANTYNKIKALVEISKQMNPGLLIEIDGGVDQQNARKLIDCGANVLVAGSSVFSNENSATLILEDSINDDDLKVYPINFPQYLTQTDLGKQRGIVKVTATLCFSFLPIKNNQLSRNGYTGCA